MYFHIDESGHTGNNLFDAAQPKMAYGVLSSITNVDARGSKLHSNMLRILNVDELHASELGIRRLTKIAPQLMILQKKMRFDFDFYEITKLDFALILFFEAVFDAGLNSAVKWETYWTPMRYIAIFHLSTLFDEEVLRESWKLCKHRQIESQQARIIALLEKLNNRVLVSDLQERTKEVFSDAFRFGIANPLKLDFGSPDPKMISPNSVGFQFVVGSMATRLRKKGKKDASSIIVDQQTEFNNSQIETLWVQQKLEEGLRNAGLDDQNYYLAHPLHRDLIKEDVLRKHTPKKKITISDSSKRIGLQIVDIYLWLSRRLFSNKPLSEELYELVDMFARRSYMDGISLAMLNRRWQRFEKQLPLFEDLTKEQLELAKKSISTHRERVKSLGI